MKGIFDLFLSDNYNLYILLFFMGAFFLECYFVYNEEMKVKISKKFILAMGTVAGVISTITIFQTDFSRHDYVVRFRPKNISCLLEAYETSWADFDKEYIETIRKVHPLCTKSFASSSINQIMLLLVFFLLGWLITILCLRVDDMLNTFLAYPVGISGAAVIGLFLHIVGIAINRGSLLICLALSVGSMLLVIKKKNIKLKVKSAILQWGLAVIVCSFSVFANLFYLSPDGIIKTFVGFNLAHFGLTRAEFLYEVEYGVVEPMLNCIGMKFSVDFVYAIYLLMLICCVGLVLTATKQLVKDKRIGILFAGVGAILLLTNHDVLFCGTYVLSNIVMACLFMVIVIAMIYQLSGRNMSLIIALISMAMITIRIEASCYLGLLIVLFCGIKEFREKQAYISIVVGTEMILWQTYMLIFAPRDLKFWNPSRSLIVIFVAAITMVAPYFLRINAKVINWLSGNYYKLAITVFVVASAAIFLIFPNNYFDVAQVFLAHFASAPDSNSLALWGYLLLMLPVMLRDKKKMSGTLISFVMCYLLATFIIYAVRINDPIHLKINDSCRRAIVQIMPTAMFVMSYILGNVKFDD